MRFGIPGFSSRFGWLVAVTFLGWGAPGWALQGAPEAAARPGSPATACAVHEASSVADLVTEDGALAPEEWAASSAQDEKRARVCKFSRACAAGRYCAKPVGDCTGFGRCSARPDVCPEFVLPVCGCNGVTYFNACRAAGAGVNVRHTGNCQ